MIIRSVISGSWCGYVGVPPGHPAFKKGYDDVEVNVHGGLTYAAHCASHICHVPKPGEPDNVWWLGFDCAHAGDGVPAINGILKKENFYSRGYKDIEYVTHETKDLAEQLANQATTRRQTTELKKKS